MYFKSQREIQKIRDTKIIKTYIITAVLMTGIYFQTTIWGKYSLEISKIKIQHLIGNSNIDNTLRAAEICAERKLYSCKVEYLKKVVSDFKNYSYLSEIADLLNRTKKYKEALNYYGEYFKLGGSNVKTAFNFAVLLEKQNNVNDALKYYEYVINSNKDRFEITASQNYVNLLIKIGDFDKAKKFIKSLQAKGENAPVFKFEQFKPVAKK